MKKALLGFFCGLLVGAVAFEFTAVHLPRWMRPHIPTEIVTMSPLLDKKIALFEEVPIVGGAEREAKRIAEQAKRNAEKAKLDAEEAARKAAEGLTQAGKETQKVTKNIVQETEKGLKAAGGFVDRSVKDVIEGGDHLGKELEKGICDIFAPGWREGRVACSVNVGVGKDDMGVYTYNPSKPEEKYYGDKKDPSNEPNLKDFAEFIKNTEISYWEYDSNDVLGIGRFLPGDYKLGTPCPGGPGSIKPPTVSGELRDKDAQGGGGFLSPRYDSKIKSFRFHGGIDYVAKPGEVIYSPITGFVDRIKNPGTRPGLYGLMIKTHDGYSSSIYYIVPDTRLKPNFPVEAGKTQIGTAQNMSKIYGGGMTNHVHVTLEDAGGRRVSPDGNAAIKPPPVPTRPKAERK